MALVQKISSLANETFCKIAPTKGFQEKLQTLREMVCKVKHTDLNFDVNLVADQRVYRPGCGVEPVTYIDLIEVPQVYTMGVFVLKHGARIPLHDHPHMYGIIKVIYGTVHVKAYTVVDTLKKTANSPRMDQALRSKAVVPVQKHPEVDVSVENDACFLTPTEGNFHEIQAVNGPAAFFDVLAPPYDIINGRECHYFKESDYSVDAGVSHVTLLERTQQPLDYFCDTAPYRGPPLDLKSFD